MKNYISKYLNRVEFDNRIIIVDSGSTRDSDIKFLTETIKVKDL